MSHIAKQVCFCDGSKQYWEDGRVIELAQPWLNHVGWLYRCCDNPRTDSWLTIGHPHDDSIERLVPGGKFLPYVPSNSAMAQLHAYHGDKVQQIHARKMAAVAQLTAMFGAKHSAQDRASNVHDVEITGVDQVDERMLADEIVWVHYRCCGSHDHIERIHRLWHGADPKIPTPKTDADVLNEVGQHRLNAALHHANVLAQTRLKLINAK
jgi:hypothetical protein